jgi:prepilin-type N-terminal cleavage/methylation domain-containing protein
MARFLRRLPFRSDDRGFTLIEALMTMVVITIAFGPILAMFNAGIWSQSASRDLTDATHQAQAIIEELRAGPYANVAPRAWTPVGGAAAFEYEVAIGPPPDPTSSGLREVTVAVRWTGRRGLESVHLTTWIAEH